MPDFERTALELFQSTWAMEIRQPHLEELSLDEKCTKAAQSGFHGLNIDLDVEDMPAIDVVGQALKAHNLKCSIVAFPNNIDSLCYHLERCQFLSATSLVVNARLFAFSITEGADFVGQCLDKGNEFGIPVHFETHRLTLTNDLLYTSQLIEQCPDLELVADLSHYVLGREMPMPVDGFHQALIQQVLSRCVSIQGRIANREQIQVPLHFTQHQDWVNQFYQWWQWGMMNWLHRAEQKKPTLPFNFTCELGPAPYAITDQNQRELSDRWAESLILKDTAQALWNKCNQR